MKPTPVTNIYRHLTIDGKRIVRIVRFLTTFEYDSGIEDKREIWGTCRDDGPDSFREIGELRDVLTTIASREMVAAAARASPARFAEMIAEAFGLGLVFYVASRAMWGVGDRIPDAKRFCSIAVDDESLTFHTLLLQKLPGEQGEVPGVYRIVYSLSDHAILDRMLVERS